MTLDYNLYEIEDYLYFMLLVGFDSFWTVFWIMCYFQKAFEAFLKCMF